jgi:hypothetical protein
MAMITSLKENQIFVFGSNHAGNHAGGAAKQAREMFGAQDGCGEGLTGRAYAFPTLRGNLAKCSDDMLALSRDRFFKFARHNLEKEFLMTAVGTGIAGFSMRKMKSLFATPPANVILPEEWR